MVPPTHAKAFEGILRTYNMEHRVKIQDVQRLVSTALLKEKEKKIIGKINIHIALKVQSMSPEKTRLLQPA